MIPRIHAGIPERGDVRVVTAGHLLLPQKDAKTSSATVEKSERQQEDGRIDKMGVAVAS
jgi:hypothetical protein